MSPAALAAWALFGAAVGTYGTLVGAGGGFLAVPALLWVAGAPPPVAAGTSLVLVGLNAGSGTLAYARRGLVDWRAAAVFALATMPGAWLGPRLLARVPEQAFHAVFGSLMLAVSAFLLARPGRPAEGGRPPVGRKALARGALLSLGVGFLASVLGIGGGVIHVPVLIYAMGFPPHVAVATSHATLAATAAAAVTAHARLGQVLWPVGLAMGLGAVGGAQLGARIVGRIGGATLVRALAVAMALVGTRCLWTGLSSP